MKKSPPARRRELTAEELARVTGGHAPDKTPEEEPPPQDQENCFSRLVE